MEQHRKGVYIDSIGPAISGKYRIARNVVCCPGWRASRLMLLFRLLYINGPIPLNTNMDIYVAIYICLGSLALTKTSTPRWR